MDTNIVSELRKRRPARRRSRWVAETPSEQLLISAVTMGELQAGVERGRQSDPGKAAEIETWLDLVPASFEILPMDSRCFREWGRLMSGQPDHLVEDAMIAAAARVHNLTVATRNERDFDRLGVSVLNPFRQLPKR